VVLFEVKIFNEFFFDRFFDVNFATLLATSWEAAKTRFFSLTFYL